MQKILYFIILARPYQWHKNIFILAPIFFAGKIFSDKIYDLLLLFLNFVTVSSAVYSINDIIDYQRDKSHPTKQNRPIASGKISKKEALTFSFVFLTISFILAYYINSIIFVVLYVFINIIYSAFIKDKKPLDIFFVSSGFVIRVLAGAHISQISPSSWLIITTFFLAVFLSTMKREAELHTKIYERIGLISATLTTVSYSLYTVLERKGMLSALSVFPVFYGIIRYYIIAEESDVKDPSILVFDREIVISFLTWLALIFSDLYLRS